MHPEKDIQKTGEGILSSDTPDNCSRFLQICPPHSGRERKSGWFLQSCPPHSGRERKSGGPLEGQGANRTRADQEPGGQDLGAPTSVLDAE